MRRRAVVVWLCRRPKPAECRPRRAGGAECSRRRTPRRSVRAPPGHPTPGHPPGCCMRRGGCTVPSIRMHGAVHAARRVRCIPSDTLWEAASHHRATPLRACLRVLMNRQDCTAPSPKPPSKRSPVPSPRVLREASPLTARVGSDSVEYVDAAEEVADVVRCAPGGGDAAVLAVALAEECEDAAEAAADREEAVRGGGRHAEGETYGKGES